MIYCEDGAVAEVAIVSEATTHTEGSEFLVLQLRENRPRDPEQHRLPLLARQHVHRGHSIWPTPRKPTRTKGIYLPKP